MSRNRHQRSPTNPRLPLSLLRQWPIVFGVRRMGYKKNNNPRGTAPQQAPAPSPLAATVSPSSHRGQQRRRAMAGAVDLQELRRAKISDGLASVLSIGTANPPNALDQSTYPDYYFRVTNSEHLVELKAKFQRICDGTKVKKRHFYLTEKILKENPNLCSWMDPSQETRREMVVEQVPRLAAEAAEIALAEWGRPRSEITHLVFCTTCGFDLPGLDVQLIKLLGLPLTVQRMMMYFQGCFAGAMALRFAKDIAENDRHARVLAVCSETTANWFRGPNPAHLDNLVGQAVLGDGAAALVVGADPVAPVERPLFEIISASERLIPESEHGVAGKLLEGGLTFHLSKEVPNIFSAHIESVMTEAFGPLGVADWNDIFWIVHPGGPAFFDKFETKLGLQPTKLWASRHVLREFGNMSSCSVLFIMDEMRRRAAVEGLPTTGDGLEYGVLLGMGPGLTAETVVLRSVATSRLLRE